MTFCHFREKYVIQGSNHRLHAGPDEKAKRQTELTQTVMPLTKVNPSQFKSFIFLISNPS